MALVCVGILGNACLGTGRGVDGGRPRVETTNARPSAREDLVIEGLRATLIDEETPARGQIAWRTTWRLCWDPIPWVAGYLVTVVSFEGDGPPHSIEERCFELTVANGLTGRSGKYPGREEQLALVETSMSANVAARAADGTLGRASRDINVGTTYP